MMRCKVCGLPDEVRDRGEQAVAEWHEQSLVNKKLFGAMHARQERADRKKKVRHPSRSKGGKAPVGVYRKLAREKRRAA